MSKLLAPGRSTAIVDVGASPIDGRPCYSNMLELGECTVVGFEPDPLALAQLNSNAGEREIYRGLAIGDGKKATLYVCRARGLSSILEPDQNRMNRIQDFGTYGSSIDQRTVKTHRLDDLSETSPVDFLKIDAQGSELSIIRNAEHRIAESMIIQVEVPFFPLYFHQPTFADIDYELRSKGFEFFCFTSMKAWPLQNSLSRSIVPGGSQLVDADAIYIRTQTLRDDLPDEKIKHLTLISFHCLRTTDLTLQGLAELKKRAVIDAQIVEDAQLIINSTR